MNPKSTSIREVKVPVSDLKIGMYVSRLDKDWVKSNFLFQGFLIDNEKLILQLQKECHSVYIDEAKQDQALAQTAHQGKSTFSFKSLFGTDSEPPEPQPQRENTRHLSEFIDHKIDPESIAPPPKSATYDEELSFAKQAHSKIGLIMTEFATQVKEGGTIDILIAHKAIYDCMESVLRSPDAMQLVMRLKNKHLTSWQHSMNNSVLAITFGRYLNLEDDELVTLGLCGLLHDIGNLRISKQALQESENKRQLIRSHTLLGRDILLHCPGKLGKTVAEVAYSHHEHLDGSGFPQGLRGGQISPFTRMISIVDFYNNLTNNRKSDKETLTHYDAMSLMLKKVDSHFDETLLCAFNQSIGIYPVGSIVEMSTGEIAMVVEANEELKLRPKIMLLAASDKQPCPKKVINLALSKATADGNPYFIKGIIRPEKYGIKL